MARNISSRPLKTHLVKLFIPRLVMVQLSPLFKKKTKQTYIVKLKTWQFRILGIALLIVDFLVLYVAV